MKFRLALIAAFASLIGCGDNSNECGPGTHSVDGVCTPDNSATCSDGTMLDTSTGSCVLDPADCQDGTVLVGNQCVDPGHVTADLEEAMEPNGLDVFGEDSSTPAGTIALKPVGQHFVVHGKIVPFQDSDGDGQLDPDTDAYVVTVTGPTLLSITADGLHGMTAGFAFVAAVDANDPLATWQRFGINLVGDTSKRQVYLPQAGTYAAVIADTRTLFLSGGAAGADTGKPAFEYYATFDAIDTPAPETLAVDTDGTAHKQGTIDPGAVKFFTMPAGSGFNNVTYDAAAPQVNESVVVETVHNNVAKVRAVANYDATNDVPPSASALGALSGDSLVIIADNVYNYATAASDYTLDVKAGTAGALSKTGAAVTQPASTTDLTLFYYDVTAADEIDGFAIDFDIPVSGAVINSDGFIFSYFTYDPNSFFDPFDISTTGFHGLIRHPAAGRYYFAVVDDSGAAATIEATSTWGSLTAVAATEGTAANVATNAYGANAITYAAGTTDPWQQFSSSVAMPALFYADDAYGRLTAFGTEADCGTAGGLTDTCTADATPIYGAALNATPKGHILLDDGTTNYLIAAKLTAAGTFTGANKPHLTLNPATGGAVVNDTAALDLTNTVVPVLVKATATNLLTTTFTGNAATDPVVKIVNANEGVTRTVDANHTLGSAESAAAIVGAGGYVAMLVSAATPAAAQSVAVTAQAVQGVTYTQSAGTTAFADACAGGTAVTLSDTDEGLSAAIAAPTGFSLFGFPSTSFRVFSNGFISFETTTCASATNCYYTNATAMPNAAAPNAIIAPYWDDLDVDSVCTKTSGTKLIIQWHGTPYNQTPIASFQAILDGSNGKIEFVYDSVQDATLNGASATVGVESSLGVAGYAVGINTASVMPGHSILLTPM